jgi:hypothetical protein
MHDPITAFVFSLLDGHAMATKAAALLASAVKTGINEQRWRSLLAPRHDTIMLDSPE